MDGAWVYGAHVDRAVRPNNRGSFDLPSDAEIPNQAAVLWRNAEEGAFGRCSITLDYISQEILRRWTKVLGVVNFSYHVPGRPGLRYWSTATLDIVDDTLIARRRTGREHSEHVVAHLKDAYDLVRREDVSRSLWVPIYRVRAAVCSQLLIPDAVFDRALIGMLEGATEPLPPFSVNVDPAQYGTVPPTELPLRVQTSHGLRNYYSMSLIPKTKKE